VSIKEVQVLRSPKEQVAYCVSVKGSTKTVIEYHLCPSPRRGNLLDCAFLRLLDRSAEKLVGIVPIIKLTPQKEP
jgi:hypothetical protein